MGFVLSSSIDRDFAPKAVVRSELLFENPTVVNEPVDDGAINEVLYKKQSFG